MKKKLFFVFVFKFLVVMLLRIVAVAVFSSSHADQRLSDVLSPLPGPPMTPLWLLSRSP